MPNEIYLDANATCPVLPAAARAASECLAAGFGNPSSSHATGLRAKAVMDDARMRARRVLGAGEGRVMFTSGATEGIQTAVLSALCAVRERQLAGKPCGRLLLYGATEHKAVPESLAHWNRVLGTGLDLMPLPVDQEGRHRLDKLRALAPEAAMVCTMAANNETGIISDMDGIGAVLAETGSSALWMVDCVQALGKLELRLADTRIDYAPFSGHKLCAPKGIGMLYVRAGAPFTPLIVGGGQEDAQRSGTENMVGIAALGAVLKALEEGGTFAGHDELARFRDRVVQSLRAAFPGVVFNARFEHALPTTVNFSVPGLSSRDLLDLFDAGGVRVSAGSACSAAKALPSYVLQAMGCAESHAASAVRMSFGPHVDEAFISAACDRIAACGKALRADPLALRQGARDSGVFQVSADGRSGWLLFDDAAGLCVAIDAPAALAPRIALLARTRGFMVRALLTNGDDRVSRADCDALCAALALQEVPFECGWPRESASVCLGDGSLADAIRLGSQWLARLPQEEGTCYLLGESSGPQLPAAAVRFGFCNATGSLAPRANAATIVCRNCDNDALPWTTVGAIAHPGAVPGHLAHLDPEALERFLHTHPEAILVDVREAFEQAAGPAVLYGRQALGVPMSRLAEHASAWLSGGEPRPLVFLCRSGNRSARAAQQLHRIGYPSAWHLAGGMAFADRAEK
jgi:cysteine desulfurase